LRNDSLEVVERAYAPSTAMGAALCTWPPAARYATLEAVQLLARRSPGALEQRGMHGWLPLHLAARFSMGDVVEWLAKQYPRSVEQKTDCGRHPLHLAARKGSDTRVLFLARAHPYALYDPAPDGSLPLHDAASFDAPLDVVYDLARATSEAIGGRFRYEPSLFRMSLSTAIPGPAPASDRGRGRQEFPLPLSPVGAVGELSTGSPAWALFAGGSCR
jgi:ankyrin repeat protein